MKRLFLIILISLFNLTPFFAQKPEQIGLDYFAKNIYKSLKRTKLSTLGIVDSSTITKEYYDTFLGLSIGCIENQEIKNEMLNRFIFDSSKINLEPYSVEQFYLRVPKKIKHTKRLHYKDFKKTRIGFYWKKTKDFIFRKRYFLEVLPSFYLKERYFVIIRTSRPDGEYGMEFYICMNKDYEVIYWCSVGWIS
jgi:hypothetical protein